LVWGSNFLVTLNDSLLKEQYLKYCELENNKKHIDGYYTIDRVLHLLVSVDAAKELGIESIEQLYRFVARSKILHAIKTDTVVSIHPVVFYRFIINHMKDKIDQEKSKTPSDALQQKP